MNVRFRCLAVLGFVLVACGQPPGDEPQIACGDGMLLNGSTCVPANMDEPVRCGGNTVLMNGVCVPTSMVCGANLVFRDGHCQVPTPAPMVAELIGRTTLQVATHSTTFGWGYGVEHSFRYVGTELSASTAGAWANSEAPMVGNGLAWHVAGRIYASGSSDVQSAPVMDDTAADGSCLATARPSEGGDPLGKREIHIGIFSWSGGVATPVACAKVGSVTFKPSPRTLTLNVQFGDGTVIERVLPMPRDN